MMSYRDILNNFIENKKMSSILIDGIWGIGKTHAVLDYVDKERKKEVKKIRKTRQFAYVSLFGKTSIDEVNTELYNQIHPKKRNLGKVFGVAVKLIEVGANRQINLGQNTFGKIKIKKKTIIIIDDLERKSDNIPSDVLVGYINSLIMQGVKVIALSNLSKVGNDEQIRQFEEYKEKVFDRVYQINKTQRDVILDTLRDSLGHDDGVIPVYVEEKISEICDNNLRMILKADTFFEQVKKFIQNHVVDITVWNDLYILCTLVVVETFDNKYSKIYCADCERIGREKGNFAWKGLTIEGGEKQEYITPSIEGILWYLDQNKISFGYSYNDLTSAGGVYNLAEGNFNIVKSVLSIFQEENEYCLKDYFRHFNNTLDATKYANEVRANIQSGRRKYFSASDGDKEELFQMQYKEIVEMFNSMENKDNKIFHNERISNEALEKIVFEDKLGTFLSDCLYFADFDEYPFTEEMENKIFEIIQKTNFDIELKIKGENTQGSQSRYHSASIEGLLGKNAQEFQSRYYAQYISKRIEYDCSFIKKNPAGIRIYGREILRLRELSNGDDADRVDEALSKFFAENNYFIEKLDGNIDLRYWHSAYEICDFIKNDFTFVKSALIEYLMNYKKENSDDKSLQHRVDILLRMLKGDPSCGHRIDDSIYPPS